MTWEITGPSGETVIVIRLNSYAVKLPPYRFAILKSDQEGPTPSG